MTTEIMFSSSFDEKHSPYNVLSTSNSQFWSCTGIYPQEIVVNFPSNKSINELQIIGYNLKKVLIETCENDQLVKFTTQSEQSNIAQKEGSLQDFTCKFSQKSQTKVVKITICEAHKEFCTINTINFK